MSPETTSRGGRSSLRHTPPVAIPIRAADLERGLAALLRPSGSIERFRSALAGVTGSQYVGLVSSGRAALATILSALKDFSNHTRVALPAYGCPSVVQAVLSAGLQPVFCDVSPRTLDLDRDAFERMPKDDLLAVVPTHLYGLAQDVTELISMGRGHGFFVVEDAAQALGATVRGKMVGTAGDAGFYSMGRGKCLPVGSGGIVVAGEYCGTAIANLLRGPGLRAHASPPVRSLALFLGYGLATHPVGWWFVARTSLNPAGEGMDLRKLPPIRLGDLSATQAAIGSSILARLQGLQQTWRSNARRLAGMLAGLDGVQLPAIAAGSEPVYLRLPFVLGTSEQANILYDRLWEQGIGVSRSYVRSLPDLYSERLALDPSAFPGAARLATCLLTLPTHSYLREEDFARTARALRSAA